MGEKYLQTLRVIKYLYFIVAVSTTTTSSSSTATTSTTFAVIIIVISIIINSSSSSIIIIKYTFWTSLFEVVDEVVPVSVCLYSYICMWVGSLLNLGIGYILNI